MPDIKPANLPIEIRNFMPYYRPEHATAGINPMVQNVNGQRLAFGPPVLQYRVKEPVFVDGVKTTQWSEWLEVGFVREGVDDAVEE